MLGPALVPQGGFCFENCQRNASLERAFPGLRTPHSRKTGTTIAGLVFRDGIILGADTRATDDKVVANENCEKIHYIAPKIYCCGAGVAADAEMITRMAASNMELHALYTGREPRVATVTRILRQTLFRCGSRLNDPGRGTTAKELVPRPRGGVPNRGWRRPDWTAAVWFASPRVLQPPALHGPGLGHYRLAPGTTAILTQIVKPLKLDLLEETVQAMEVE
ncbi:proteasome subunit beta type-10 isoform X4 [Fukomys damarensis]|uniref:proteasome subunit beta type-10 isoform X4 n=1 Tax=Fukomys damarensis TaxID=885580 RepID=UPI00053FDA29|nr:proteasome subunit beta type-10 isoform X4 [Fukomys damarensis]